MKSQVKKDKYSRARGGESKLLDIKCSSCGAHLATYQKDGPGALKRMYKDRFKDGLPEGKNFECPKCNKLLGVEIVYQKENRLAYRLFVGAVVKSKIK